MKFECNTCHEHMEWEELNSHACPRITQSKEETMSVKVPCSHDPAAIDPEPCVVCAAFPPIRIVSKDTTPTVRRFETGATRDTDANKLDYEAFFSPSVLKRRAQFMHKHRVQPDGRLRDGDNWKKGIPQRQYMKSLARHYWDIWAENHGITTEEGLEEAICAAMFNLEGMLYEVLKARDKK